MWLDSSGTCSSQQFHRCFTKEQEGAGVVPDKALGVNLLGMSSLARVRGTHERGRLVLEQ